MAAKSPLPFKCEMPRANAAPPSPAVGEILVTGSLNSEASATWGGKTLGAVRSHARSALEPREDGGQCGITCGTLNHAPDSSRRFA